MAFFICGFTGSGKTTLLKKLSADKACKRAIDLDHYILENFGERSDHTLGDYIRRVGFDVFRDNEQLAIINLTNDLGEGDIVALGGGSLERLFNFERIKSTGHLLVWLDVAFDVCYERIKGDRNRPLLEKDKDELKAIFKIREERFKLADIRLDLLKIGAVHDISSFKSACSLD